MSVVSYSAFIIDYPEFKETDRLLIERKLEKAELYTPYNIWGSKQRSGICLLAAHYLAISPIGEQSRLKENSIETVYGEERKREEQIVVCGLGRTL